MQGSFSPSMPGVSKAFARTATRDEMNFCGAALDYNTGRGLYSIHFMNHATWAGLNLIKGRIWPAARTLDMPGLCRFSKYFRGCCNFFQFDRAVSPFF